MTAKLTLTIDKTIVDAAKLYAKASGTSLSTIIEQYLKNLLRENDSQEISTRLKKIIGTVKLPKKFKEKKELLSYLKEKHS